MRAVLTRLGIGLLCLYVLTSVAGGVFLAEVTLHLPRRPVTHTALAQRTVANEFHAQLQDVYL